MKINSYFGAGINRISGVSNINMAAKAAVTPGNVSITENFVFPDKIIDYPPRSNKSAFTIEESLQNILIELFLLCLRSGVVIKPTQKRIRNNVIIEGSFMVDKKGKYPIIMVPIPHLLESLIPSTVNADKDFLYNLIKAKLKQTFLFSSATDIQQLIIVTAHEYGHFRSYMYGNHSKALELGLYYLKEKVSNSQLIENYTWLVFKEECEAWLYAKKILATLKFASWNLFNKVKSDGLSIYLSQLNLKKANLNTIYRLSLLGEDFTGNYNGVFKLK